LVYLTSKRDPYSLFLPAVFTGIISGILFPFLFHFYFHFQKTELLYFIGLTLLSNLSSILNYFLNGFEKIKQNNMASMAQSLAIISSLATEFFILKDYSVFSFYRSLAIGYTVNLCISAYA